MIIPIFLLLFVAVIFAIQNSQVVSISFLTFSFSTVQALVILFSLFIGLLIGWAWAWFKGAKVRAQVKELTKALEAAKADALPELHVAMKYQPSPLEAEMPPVPPSHHPE